MSNISTVSRARRGVIARVLTLSAMIALCPLAVTAGSLKGRIVTLYVLTYDDPATPILESQGRTVQVDQGIEFGMGPEYRTPGYDVVPVQIEIGPQRIEFSYPEPAGVGEFLPAQFNGYVLKFETECALFDGWQIDPEATTMQVGEADIYSDKGALYINVESDFYGPDQTLALDLSVADCPMS